MKGSDDCDGCNRQMSGRCRRSVGVAHVGPANDAQSVHGGVGCVSTPWDFTQHIGIWGDRWSTWRCQSILDVSLALKQLTHARNFKVCSDNDGIINRSRKNRSCFRWPFSVYGYRSLTFLSLLTCILDASTCVMSRHLLPLHQGCQLTLLYLRPR